MDWEQCILDVRPMTAGPGNHFFGYYDKEQWDPTDRYMLAHRVGFLGRTPGPGDVADICIIDSKTDRIEAVSATRAWNWQQGSMLQWIPGSASELIHNDRIGDRFVSVVIDSKTGHRRVLPRPVYTLNRAGTAALSLNFARLADTRPGYGYNGLDDYRSDANAPGDDGIYIMDLETGEHRMIISLEQVVQTRPLAGMELAKHWFNHLLFNPSGKRFVFLHRWVDSEGRRNTRLCTARTDGSELFISKLTGGSHFIWVNDTQILIWGTSEAHGAGYHLIEDQTDAAEIIGKGVLRRDGHCTISRNGRWVLTDEYPDTEDYRTLILYHLERRLRIDIGRFFSPPEFTGEFRCDLHPRWSRDGRLVSIDSAHHQDRQIYVVDVGSVIDRY